MFNFFTTARDFEIQYGIKKYYKWNVMRKMYLQELDKIKEYYRGREYNFSNNNPLVRLVKILARSPDLDVLEYYGYIENEYKYIERQFDIVSNGHSGEVLNNVLFKGNSEELFLSVDNTVDPYTMETIWRDYSPIRVIKTSLTDVYYPVLFDYEKYDPDMTVFEIDTKALLLQYYYWARERKSLDRDISANVFIPTVVIPNITDSLIDYAIWNRFKAIALKEKLYKKHNKHPLYVIDYTKGIDDVLEDIAKDNTNTSIFIPQLLKTVNSIVNESAYETLFINKFNYTRQSLWVLWVSRMDEIVALHKMLGKRGYRINLELFNKLPYEIRLIKNREGVYSDKLDVYNLEKFKENMKYLEDHLGKR